MGIPLFCVCLLVSLIAERESLADSCVSEATEGHCYKLDECQASQDTVMDSMPSSSADPNDSDQEMIVDQDSNVPSNTETSDPNYVPIKGINDIDDTAKQEIEDINDKPEEAMSQDEQDLDNQDQQGKSSQVLPVENLGQSDSPHSPQAQDNVVISQPQTTSKDENDRESSVVMNLRHTDSQRLPEENEQTQATASEHKDQDGGDQEESGDKKDLGCEGSGEKESCAVEESDKDDGSSKDEVGDGDEVKSKGTDTRNLAENPDDTKTKDEGTLFPSTLEGFGYHFKDGRLVDITTGEGFVYEVKYDKDYNQAHYEAIGEVITEEVYSLLESETKLKRFDVPVQPQKKNHSFIFMSEDALQKEKLMVLIHGSGVVRAGQWARSLIINDCLDSGTQLPFIRKAKEEGYGVLVMNTNENSKVVKGKIKYYKDVGSPERHARYVWKHFVKKSKAKDIYIVAHSYGGVVTVDLVDEYFAHFKDHVRKIAFTDSVHSFNQRRTVLKKWLCENAVNWVSSDEELDTEPSGMYKHDVPQRSAGTTKHVETSWYSFRSIFNYFRSS